MCIFGGDIHMIEDKVPEEEISRYRERLYYEQLLMKWLDEIFHLFYNQYMRGDFSEGPKKSLGDYQAPPQRGLKIKRMVDSIRTLICLLPERVREELKDDIKQFRENYKCTLYIFKPWASERKTVHFYACVPACCKEAFKELKKELSKNYTLIKDAYDRIIAAGYKTKDLEEFIQKIDATIHEKVVEACQELLEKIVIALEREGLLFSTRDATFLNFPETEKGERIEK